MSKFSGTPISEQDRAELISMAGTILDQYKEPVADRFNDKSASLTGTAYSSGLRLWDTPEGCKMEYPKTLELARQLVAPKPAF